MSATHPDSAPRFAVVLKTYTWDAFIERQATRFAAAAGGGDFYISMDETNGVLPDIGFPLIERTSNAKLIESGLANRFERGSLIWWNADYPHYAFYDVHDDYDYYVFVEYDTLIQIPIADLVQQIAASKADFVAGALRSTMQDWFWTRYHLQTYSMQELRGTLNCISVFSNRALALLHQRRLAMSADPGVRYWPSAEAFVATEIERAGYRFEPLDKFGDVSKYDWFPPTLEDDLLPSEKPAFIHPLLNSKRFITTTLRSNVSPFSLVNPNSHVRRQLARFPRADYMHLLPQALRRRLRDVLAERIERIWLRMPGVAAKS